MFDKLRGAFSSTVKSLGEKELKEKDVENALSDLEIALLESDVAIEVIDSVKSDLKKKLIGLKIDKNEIEKFVRDSLISIVSALFDGTEKIDLFERINEKKKMQQPFLILFVGINGVGKTTSLAKVAHMLQKAKYSVVVAASDTFRAGAIEQLRAHTDRLNLKLVAQNYQSDPAAVARDAVLYARSHKTDCVLIDTAGRMQTSTNLMEQISKISKVVQPDMKIFVGDSLAGNDTVNQAREFHRHVQFNGSILTKSDADARGGAALSIVKATSTPIMFVGVGQEHDDLIPFEKKVFLETVFGSLSDVKIYKVDESASDIMPEIEPELTPEIEPKIKPEPEVKSESKPEPTLEPKPESTPKPEPTPEVKPEPTSKPEPTPELKPEPAPKSESTPKPEPTPKVKPEPTPKVKPEPTPKVKSEPEPTPASDDPFEGINDDDIATYSDLFDVPPPENDNDAVNLANKIRQWIKRGRPDPEDLEEKEKEKEKEEEEEEDIVVDTHARTDDKNKNDNDKNDNAKNIDGENNDGKSNDDKNSDDTPESDPEQKEDKPKKRRGMMRFFKK